MGVELQARLVIFIIILTYGILAGELVLLLLPAKETRRILGMKDPPKPLLKPEPELLVGYPPATKKVQTTTGKTVTLFYISDGVDGCRTGSWVTWPRALAELTTCIWGPLLVPMLLFVYWITGNGTLTGYIMIGYLVFLPVMLISCFFLSRWNKKANPIPDEVKRTVRWTTKDSQTTTIST